MDPENKKIIKQRITVLNPKLREEILSGGIESIIKEISERKLLGEEQSLSLENEVLLVLLGLDPVEDFADSLIDDFGFDIKTALGMEVEIENKIFSRFYDEIKRVSLIPVEDEVNKNSTEGIFGIMMEKRAVNA